MMIFNSFIANLRCGPVLAASIHSLFRGRVQMIDLPSRSLADK